MRSKWIAWKVKMEADSSAIGAHLSLSGGPFPSHPEGAAQMIHCEAVSPLKPDGLLRQTRIKLDHLHSRPPSVPN
jgi:hypothetical protein